MVFIHRLYNMNNGINIMTCIKISKKKKNKIFNFGNRYNNNTSTNKIMKIFENKLLKKINELELN